MREIGLEDLPGPKGFPLVACKNDVHVNYIKRTNSIIKKKINGRTYENLFHIKA